jgi:hypothetical protein
MKLKPKCICCGKKIKHLYEDELGINTDPISDAWDGAGVHEFIPGYGSDFDLSSFIISVCDKCIKSAIEEKRLLLIGDDFSKFA